jgi:DNA-binding transcriptional MerR regulator
MASTTRSPRTRPPARRDPSLLALETFAQRAGLHPEVVRRLARLGLLEPGGGTTAAPLYRASDAALLVRAVRLRGDLGLNYAGAVLACELLARIEELERLIRLNGPTPAYRR